MTILISCGEPAGIGPEIAARAWEELQDEVVLAWIGDSRHLPRGTPVAEIERPEDAARISGALPVLARDLGPYARGQVWAEPDVDSAARAMRDVAASPALRARLRERGLRTVAEELSPAALAPRIAGRIARLHAALRRG